jgi:hypothetical protein
MMEKSHGVSMKGAIPLVLIVAFGTTLANRFADAAVDYVEAKIEIVIEKSEPLVDALRYAMRGPGE